jgi:hypothetical protein
MKTSIPKHEVRVIQDRYGIDHELSLTGKVGNEGGLDALHQHVRCCVVLAISRERIKKP